ncbi:MAG TPA: hypothetical protein VFZ25_00235 [Chloroflexota bacterium]|nr:hypothetical protein [Chloroflexota bacterium]
MTETPGARKRAVAIGRRRLLRGGAVAVVGAVLVACSGNPPTTPSPPRLPSATPNPPASPITLPTPTLPPSPEPTATAVPPTPTPVPRLVTIWTADSSSILVKAIESVGRTLSGQTPPLQVAVVGGQADYGKIVQSLALTIGPDLIDPGALTPYATRGVLRALDGYLASGPVQPTDFPQVMWDNGQWQGKTYGVPALDNGPELGLLVNRALVGGNVTTPDSWDRLFSFGLAATKKGGQGIDVLGWDPLNGVGGLLQTVESLTGQPWNDPKTKKVILNNPVYQSYLDHLRAYYGALGIESLDSFRKKSATAAIPADSGLARGSEAAVIGGYRLAAALGDNASQSFVANWIPAPAGSKVQRLGGHFLAIPTVAPRPDDSWAVLSFLAGDQANNLLFAEAGCCAWSNTFLTSQGWQKRPAVGFYANSMTQYTSIEGQPVSPIAGYAQGIWQAAVGNVIQNGTSPADALKAAQSAVDAEIERLAGAAKAGSGG